MQYTTEIELNKAKETYSPGNPAIAQLENQLAQIKSQLSRIHGSNNNEFTFPLEKAPDILKEYGILQRNLKVQEEIYLFLTKIYEESRYKEANTVPNIRILHYAFVPEKKIWPVKRKLVLYSIIFAEIMTVVLILFGEFVKIEQIRNPANLERVFTLANTYTFELLS